MRILVTLDGSKLSEAVLEPVERLARAAGAEVHLLIVGRPLRSLSPGKRQTPDVMVKLPMVGSFPSAAARLSDQPRKKRAQARDGEQRSIARREQELDEYLMEKAGAFEGLQVRRVAQLGDNPSEVIIDYARRQGVDLVAMATHGRSGLSRLVQGSVASQVMESGAAPVLLVRPLGAGFD